MLAIVLKPNYCETCCRAERAGPRGKSVRLAPSLAVHYTSTGPLVKRP
jgi:hypothetical protein